MFKEIKNKKTAKITIDQDGSNRDKGRKILPKTPVENEVEAVSR